MDNEKIRIATSIPSLKSKIHTNIASDSDVIYWYIKFNIPLDEKSVNDKTMGVTDTSGYIMRTDINYDQLKNMIIISPLDTYEQNRFYLLRISKKVKSKKGQKLKSNINILFKLMNNQISEYKVLKKESKIPEARKRPRDYDVVHTRSKVYSIDGKMLEKVRQDKLPYADLNINILIGALGIVLLAVSYFLGNLTFLAVSTFICLIGFGHIMHQFNRDSLKSLRNYNKGVRKFNKSRYPEAKSFFIKALMIDDTNEYAEYASNKVEFYLDVPRKESYKT